jgi:hypothetical protein
LAVSTTFDTAALRQGGSVALVFAVPFAIGAGLLSSHSKGSPWIAVLWLCALAGFTIGAGVAAWAQTKQLPLLHGMVCAGGTYLITQGVFTIIRLARGASVSWLALFFTFTAVVFAGLVGGGLGSTLRKRGFVPGGKAPE